MPIIGGGGRQINKTSSFSSSRARLGSYLGFKGGSYSRSCFLMSLNFRLMWVWVEDVSGLEDKKQTRPESVQSGGGWRGGGGM